jgi:hypothetical protein
MSKHAGRSRSYYTIRTAVRVSLGILIAFGGLLGLSLIVHAINQIGN